jgi:NADPH-dependent 2,4-dienoyl-CoA reductase/sulfur reductase-like enzyme
VVLFEAAPRPGGQLRLAAALARRREIIGIVDWLESETRHLGVDLRCNRLAEAADVLAEAPDVVVIATGGVPDLSFLAEGEELATTSWDILSGHAAPAREILLFDDHGGHPGASCAELLARAGARLEFVTPERILLPEIGGTNYPAYLKAFGEHGVAITLNRRLRAIRREGNRLAAVLYDEYARASEERLVDQVVIERGTLPADDLYFELRPQSMNLGEIDQGALLAGRPQTTVANPSGSFQLFRVGDAVASRNIHAAIYDSLRLCKDL